MRCKYCNEVDESRLILSSRLVNGRIIEEWICFRCFWRDEFVHEAEEDGNALSERCERADNKTVSTGSLDSPGLRE